MPVSKPKSPNRKLALYYTYLVNSLNKAIKPVEKLYNLSKKAVEKSKGTFPATYGYFDSIIKRYLIPGRTLLQKPSFTNLAGIMTSHISKFIPFVDDANVEISLAKNPRNTFIKAIYSGLGLFATRKNYSILGDDVLFKRVLIANRGEIALRVIRACKELGIETVAIYSKDEKDSLAVKFADKSYNIGASKNYLDIKKVIEIAKKVKADAIHPGYGFLAENAKFAGLCEKNKIKFIGPTSKMIAALGNKIAAKKSMQNAGIPVIRGTSSVKSIEQALQTAEEIGYPIIIKASSGGGGKGMRIVRSRDEANAAYEISKSEAMSSFGDNSVYIEKYIEEPRHIEFQIIADRYGNIIHLGERDCTIQRKHQKLIEESPSPALTPEIRERIGNAAVNAIKAIRYEGAGTVEFLFDKDGSYYFIEMNTRIQVEHGVTEMVTGVDLVKEQIKLAGGARLAIKQEDIKIDGCAIECRINAEDPFNNFMPSPGTIINYLPPGGPGIRISSSSHQGYKIEPDFDSLIALIICHGKTRQEALARIQRALDEYVIEGISTTIPFHKYVLTHHEFIRGNVTTSFIEKYRILNNLKKLNKKSNNNKEISQSKKILVVTTAVSQYLSKKEQNGSYVNGKNNPWIAAARQESMNEGTLEE